jgi:iron complex outermembrane recepter protein
VTKKSFGNGAAWVRMTVAAIIGATTVGYFAPVLAAESEDTQLDEVQVTGTRIKRASDFDTANPTTVVDADYFENLGIVNVGDAVKSLPSNVSTFSPTATGNSNFFAGSTIANLRGLNPFFGSRTLTLVNGRRHVPTNQGDGVDLNFIPSVLIERVDVVTGGASAAYGSGAISGVNNIYLNRNLQGVKLDVDYGQSVHNDAKDRHVGAAFGSSFADDRGHFVLGYERQDSDALGCIKVRDWCAEGRGFRQNERNTTPNLSDNQTTFVRDSNLRASQISYNTVFQNFGAPFGAPTLQSNAAGTGTIPFNAGTGANGSPFNIVVGGDGRSIYEYTNLRAPVKRDVAMGSLKFALTESLQLTAEASWGQVNTLNRNGQLDARFQSVAADNAYLRGNPGLIAAQAQFALFPGGPAFINKDWTSQLDTFSEFDTELKRISVGLDGRFGDSTWTWDTYYQYGKSSRTQLVNDNVHLNAYNLAVDSIIDPRPTSATFGRPICRSDIAGVPFGFVADPRIANDCKPVNPFGTSGLTPEGRAYAWGFLHEATDITQQVVAFNTTGRILEGYAGDIQGAVGVEFRTEKGSNVGSQNGAPDYVRTDYLIQYGESFGGKVDVIETYAELDLPILRDQALAKRLEFNLAGRYSNYKNKGTFGPGAGISRDHSLVTWKASSFWDPVDGVRVRGTRSRDSRAANFRELYYGQQIKSGGLFGFCGAFFSFIDPCDWSLEGNVDVKPEKADTSTIGLVFTPKEIAPGLEFAADYFHIKITDAIQQANIFRVLNGCQISNIPEFCALLTPDVPGVFTYNPATGTGIKTVRALAFNGSGYKYRGIDFSGAYKWALTDSSTINFRLLATRMLEQSYQPTPSDPVINIVGQTGASNNFLNDNQPSARWLANFSSTYQHGNASLTMNVRYVASGVIDYLPTAEDSLNDNTVPSYTVFALNGSYKFRDLGKVKSLQVWAGVDNVFDKDPPFAAGSGNGTGGTNPIFFDTIGRAFKLGIRAELF